MALSMLTACGSSTTTTSDDITSAVVAASTNNTAVVSYIQSKMNKSDVGSKQAGTTLSGKEEDHLEEAVTVAKNKNLQVIDIDDVSNMDYTQDITYTSPLNIVNHRQGGKTYVFAVEKEGNSDTDLAEKILARMQKFYTADDSLGDYFRYDKISVFDATMTYDYTTVASNLTIGGTTVMNNVREFWVVVVTTSADSTAQTGTY